MIDDSFLDMYTQQPYNSRPEESKEIVGCPFCRGVYVRTIVPANKGEEYDIRDTRVKGIRYDALEPSQLDICLGCEGQRQTIERLLKDIPVKLFNSLGEKTK